MGMIEDGSFDLEVEVLADSDVTETINATANGSFDLQVTVDADSGGEPSPTGSVDSGSFDLTVYIEYFEYGNWSEWWNVTYASVPEISNPNPVNNSNGNNVNLVWTVDINNPDGHSFNWSIESSSGLSNSSNYDSNGTKELTMNGLAYDTKYTVWVNATSTISDVCNTSSFYNFTTYNPPPVISSENPSNNTEIPSSFNPLSIYISDLQGELMDWSIELSDGTNTGNVNSGNGTKNCAIVLNEGISYTWWVNVTDGTSWTRRFYNFDTSSNEKPEMILPNPANNSIGNNVTDTTQFTINLADPEGDSINWNIQVSNGDSSSGNFQSNGTKTCSLTTPLSYNTEYKIWVNASDPAGSGDINRSWYVFNTETVGGFPPTLVINTTTDIHETNATANSYISNSVFPARAWFRYRTPSSTYASTTEEGIGIGEYHKTITGLTPGSYYYIQARASNIYGINSTGFINFLTLPNPPSGLTIGSYNHSNVSLSWTKGTGANTTVVERNTIKSWDLGAGTEIYNGTEASYQDMAVNPSTTYYYQAWSYAEFSDLSNYSSTNASVNITTLPQPPQNVVYSFTILGNGTGNLTINWNKGTGADNTHIMKNTGSAPNSVTEGIEAYNNTGTTVTDAFISVPYLYTLWSWNSTTGLYSEPVYLGWYASWINVYNESKPSQAVLNWNIEISNPEGDEVYASNSNNNPLIINISDMPTGVNIGFSFTAPDYKNRVYKKDVSETGAIFFNAYLPPDYVPTSDTGSGGGDPTTGELRYHTETGNISNYNTDETINLDRDIYEIDVVEKYERVSYDRFLHADSATVTNPTSNLVMTLNFTCDEIYNVVAYENLNTEDIYTDSASVTDPTTDKNISFNHKPVGQVIGVYEYNNTLYGGWIWVSGDDYSYDSDNVTVNASAMDDNTTMVKVDYILDVLDQGVVERPISHDKVTITGGTTATVDSSALNTNTTLVRIEYYTYINEYYNWIYIPKQKYTSTINSVTVDSSELSENTLLIRVKYYSYDDSTYIEPNLYVLQVIDPSGSPVDDAKVIVKRYINTTGVYTEIGSYITDGNGQMEIFLIPYVNYKIQINASDQGFETKTYDYTPSDSVFIHTLRISIAETSPSEENMFTGITWSIEPTGHYQRGNFTFYYNITSSSSELEWFKAIVYYYNETTDQWEIIYSENDTTHPAGGSISYTIENANISLIAGKYKIESWYKKEGYNPYEVTQTESTIVFLEYGGFGSSSVWDNIPDWVYLLVTVIIMALVMAVLLPIAGLGTGYVGLGIFAIALMLKPDLVMDSGISGWAIFTITTILYSIALFIWSRI